MFILMLLNLFSRNETGFVESSVVGEDGNSTEKKKKCCSGLCVDLLRKFEEDLGFSYDLVRAEDPKWGTLEVLCHFRFINQNKFEQLDDTCNNFQMQ